MENNSAHGGNRNSLHRSYALVLARARSLLRYYICTHTYILHCYVNNTKHTYLYKIKHIYALVDTSFMCKFSYIETPKPSA